MQYLVRTISEDWTVQAKDFDEAIVNVERNMRDAFDAECDETFWIEVNITEILPATDEDSDDYIEPESVRYYVEIDPVAPRCVDGSHVWEDESDYVYQGSSGIGISYWQVCKKCGCGKHYDSGASGPNYSGGWESIRYEADRYQPESD